MARISRRTHLTVEECCPLRLRDLTKAGVSLTQNRASGTLTWSEGDRAMLSFTVLLAGENTYLSLAPQGERVPLESRQSFELTRSPCNFGGVRFWFSCPGLIKQPCGRRVAVLYRAPGSPLFACRTCLKLTYSSVQTHDRRLDRAVRDADYLLELLNSHKFGQRLLGLRAVAKLSAFSEKS